MKSRIHKLILLLILIYHCSSVSFTPASPTAQSPVPLDNGPGTSMPMTTKLDIGVFVTIYQVATDTSSTLYFSMGTNAAGTVIASNTLQQQAWVACIGGGDAAAIYETYNNQTTMTSMILNVFTKSPQVTFTIDTYLYPSFTELRPNMVRSGTNLAVVWSQGTTIYGKVYTINTGVLNPSTTSTVYSCSAGCLGRVVSASSGKFAIVYKQDANNGFTMSILFLNANLTNDASINNGQPIAIPNAPSLAGLPAATTRRDGSEVAVVSISSTNIYVLIYNTTTGLIVSQNPCAFNLNQNIISPAITETATAGLYVISFTASDKKIYFLFTDNTCSINILSDGTSNIQLDSTAGMDQDYASLASIDNYTSSAFFVSYVETNTYMAPIAVRIKARLYSMSSDCLPVTIYTIPIVSDPLSLAKITANKVYITSLPQGNMLSGSNSVNLNTSINRNSISYNGTNFATDSFAYKISKYDTPCLASIIRCSSECATCNGKPDGINMYCLTCADTYFIAEGTGNCYKKDALVPQFYFSIDKFKPCYKNCQTCVETGLSDKDQRCKTCPNGYSSVIDDSSLCFKAFDRPESYYYDQQNGTFNYCYKTCRTCLGPGNDSYQNCLTCADHFAKKDDGLNCYNTATPLDGYKFDTNTSMYIKCYSSCKTCSDVGIDTMHNCGTCIDGFYNTVDELTNCYRQNSKITGYFFDTTDLIFKRCYERCSFCTATGDILHNNCNGCLDTKGFYPIASDLSKCYSLKDNLDGYYLDTTTNSFQMCYKNCSTCTKSGTIVQPNCLICKDGMDCNPCNDYVYNGTCVKSCIDTTYLDSKTKTCLDCTPDIPDCCANYFYQQKCYKTCPPGTLVSESGRSCYACYERSQFFYQGVCLDECPRGSLKNDSICKRCVDDGQVFYNDTCVSQCPAGLAPIGGVCDNILTASGNYKF
jgi:hypothetical protein